MTPGLDLFGPLASTGLVGIFFLMIVLRVRIMPTYVHDDAKKEWERERAELRAALDEAEDALREGQKILLEKVTPALTLALDAERQILEMKQREQYRRGVTD